MLKSLQQEQEQVQGQEAHRDSKAWVEGTHESRSPGCDIDTVAADAIALVQLLLAEKRTSLSVLRTGITIGVVPLSITTVLVTLSRFYDWLDNLHFLAPMYASLSLMMVASFYLVARSMRRIHHQDKLIEQLRRSQNPRLRKFIDLHH